MYYIMLTRSKKKLASKAIKSESKSKTKSKSDEKQASLSDVIGIIENHAAVNDGSAMQALKTLSTANTNLANRYVKVLSEKWKRLDLSCFDILYEIFEEFPKTDTLLKLHENGKIVRNFRGWSQIHIQFYKDYNQYHLQGYGNEKYFESVITLRPSRFHVKFTVCFAQDRDFERYVGRKFPGAATMSSDAYDNIPTFGIYMTFEWEGKKMKEHIQNSIVDVSVIPVMSKEYGELLIKFPSLLTPLLQCIHKFYKPIKHILNDKGSVKPDIASKLFVSSHWIPGVQHKHIESFNKQNKDKLERFLTTSIGSAKMRSTRTVFTDSD